LALSSSFIAACSSFKTYSATGVATVELPPRLVAGADSPSSASFALTGITERFSFRLMTSAGTLWRAKEISFWTASTVQGRSASFPIICSSFNQVGG
jgi:hypothetical protein